MVPILSFLDRGQVDAHHISEESLLGSWLPLSTVHDDIVSAMAVRARPPTCMPTYPPPVPSLSLQAKAADPSPQIRCTGSSHSWTSLFADDGAWLVDTSGLKDITWSATENPTQVIYS